MARLWNLEWVRYVRACLQLFFQKGILQAAAGIAYFLMMTMFPLLICVNALLSRLHIDTMQAVSFLEGMIPGGSIDLIANYLQYLSRNDSTALLLAGAALGITAAAAAYRALSRMMAEIYERPQIRGIRRWVQSILFPVMLVLTIYVAIGVVLTGDWLLNLLAQMFSWERVLGLWRYLRFLLLFCVFFLFVLGISISALPRGTARVPLLVGVSVLFSMFISFSTRYSLVYGSLMSIMVLLIWLYLCATILLIANVISSVWFQHYGGHVQVIAPREKPQGD